jgi:hypothetical protein
LILQVIELVDLADEPSHFNDGLFQRLMDAPPGVCETSAARQGRAFTLQGLINSVGVGLNRALKTFEPLS